MKLHLSEASVSFANRALNRHTLLATLMVLNFSCAIKTVVVDRHTLMEAESAGQWPAVDQKVLARSKKKGVTFQPKDEVRGKMAKPYQMLNGEPVETKHE